MIQSHKRERLLAECHNKTRRESVSQLTADGVLLEELRFTQTHVTATLGVRVNAHVLRQARRAQQTLRLCALHTTTHAL